MFSLEKLLRPNILNIQPYSSARDEYTGKEGVFLDANENPFDSVGTSGYNRYPDPHQEEVKHKISALKNTPVSSIFLGNGSDEPIDLLIRAFCEPKEDNIIILPPTYGMYRVSADINNVEVREVNLTPEYQINLPEVLKAIDKNTKIIWVCSPNNPTANLIKRADIYTLLQSFNGIVVVDEAYIDFASEPSFIAELPQFPNLVVLQTFSKAWGMAALRLGMAFTSKGINAILNKIKYPYNINLATQQFALIALNNEQQKNDFVAQILAERQWLSDQLATFETVRHIYSSDANFLLIKIDQAKSVFDQLIQKLIIVRDRSKVVLCQDCLRISIGTPEENKVLISVLKTIIK